MRSPGPGPPICPTVVWGGSGGMNWSWIAVSHTFLPKPPCHLPSEACLLLVCMLLFWGIIKRSLWVARKVGKSKVLHGHISLPPTVELHLTLTLSAVLCYSSSLLSHLWDPIIVLGIHTFFLVSGLELCIFSFVRDFFLPLHFAAFSVLWEDW